MNIIEYNGKALLQQYEGNRQLVSALSNGAQLLLRRVTKLLAAAFRRLPGAHPF